MRAILTVFDENTYSCKDTIYQKEDLVTDTFRKEYKPLSDETKLIVSHIKDKAEELLASFEAGSVNASIDMRAMALAKTNLEQAVMWAIKSITS